MESYLHVWCVAQNVALANNGNWLHDEYRTLLQNPYKDNTSNMASFYPGKVVEKCLNFSIFLEILEFLQYLFWFVQI